MINIIDTWLVFINELKGLFRDRNAVLVNFMVPLVLLPILVLGIALPEKIKQDQYLRHDFTVEIIGNNDIRLKDIIAKKIRTADLPDIKNNADFKIVFLKSAPPVNQARISLFYNTNDVFTSIALPKMREALNEYGKLAFKDSFSDAFAIEEINGVSKEKTLLNTIAGVLSYVIILNIFTGMLMIGLATTAGEKEKGSFQILLVSRINRTDIAGGKILYVVFAGFLNSLCSAIGLLIASVVDSRFLLTSTSPESDSINMSSFLLDFFKSGRAGIFFVELVVLSFVFASLIILIGIRCKTVKEANGYTFPCLILVVLTAIQVMNNNAPVSLIPYMIPILNSAYCMKMAVLGEISMLPILCTIFVNCVVITMLISVTVRLFSSEKIMQTH